MTTRVKFFCLFPALLVVACIATLWSCTSITPAQRESILASAAASQETANTQRAQEEAVLAAAIASGNTSAAEKARKAIATIDKIKAAIDVGTKTFTGVVGPDGSIDIVPVA